MLSFGHYTMTVCQEHEPSTQPRFILDTKEKDKDEETNQPLI